jgi:sporulation protein YlmC with PRC-barrel domain
MKAIKIHQRPDHLRGVFLVCLFTLLAMSATVLAQQSQTSANRPREDGDTQTMEEPWSDIRAGELVGQHVQNQQGKVIAEIDDLIITPRGRIRHIILAVGGVLGIAEKLIAVDFDDLQFQIQWNYRTIRTQDGTTEQIAWERRPSVIFEGSENELLSNPPYVHSEKHPRGGPTGWGVYSYPAGPKSIEEVP